MSTGAIIWLIVAIVLVLIVIGLVLALMNKRKTQRADEHREQAAHLRQDAQARAGGVQESDLQAREAKLEAERARVEAERKDAQAAEAEQGHLQERAHHEDQLREADRVDPDVDHRAGDYRPGTPEPGTSGTSGTSGTAGTTDTTGTAEPGTEPRAAEDPVHEPPTEGTDGTSSGPTHRA